MNCVTTGFPPQPPKSVEGRGYSDRKSERLLNSSVNLGFILAHTSDAAITTGSVLDTENELPKQIYAFVHTGALTTLLRLTER